MQLLLINCFSTNLLEAQLKAKTLSEIVKEKNLLKKTIAKAQTNNFSISNQFNLYQSFLFSSFRDQALIKKICIIFSHYFWNKTELINE